MSVLISKQGLEIDESLFGNRAIAFVGKENSGKSTSIFKLKKTFDSTKTLIISKTRVVYAMYDDSIGFDFSDDIDLEPFRNVIIENADELTNYPKLLKRVKKYMDNVEYTFLLTFTDEKNANKLGFGTTMIATVKGNSIGDETFSMSELSVTSMGTI